MKGYDEDCTLCRLMRSLAFTGIGMAIGSGGAYFVGANKQDMVLSGIVVAAIIVFGMLDRKK